MTCQNSSAALLISSVSEKSLIFCFIIHCFDDVCLMNISILVHHTSASLTINENYDSDVRDDTETFLNKIVPEVNTSPSFSFLFHLPTRFSLWTLLLTFLYFLCFQGRSAPWKHTLEGQCFCFCPQFLNAMNFLFINSLVQQLNRYRRGVVKVLLFMFLISSNLKFIHLY